MRTVPLGGLRAAGRVALVDDSDYDLVIAYHWNVQEVTAPGSRSGPYARTTVGRDALFMHNLIASFPKPDHIDGNGLNNQRSNLRRATAGQNGANRRAWGESPYKGVSRNGSGWMARIGYKHRIIGLGTFTTEEEAAQAYDVAAAEMYGGFARLNFPECA